VSADRVVGVAILDRTMSPERLIVKLERGDGKPINPTVIPVYPKGTPKPATRNGAAWEYEVRGNRLHITPSLHVRHQNSLTLEWVTDFHNGYSWDVEFREARPKDPAQQWETDHLRRDLREANPA
jgi:hypothetical protein